MSLINISDVQINRKTCLGSQMVLLLDSLSWSFDCIAGIMKCVNLGRCKCNVTKGLDTDVRTATRRAAADWPWSILVGKAFRTLLIFTLLKYSWNYALPRWGWQKKLVRLTSSYYYQCQWQQAFVIFWGAFQRGDWICVHEAASAFLMLPVSRVLRDCWKPNRVQMMLWEHQKFSRWKKSSQVLCVCVCVLGGEGGGHFA